MTKKKKDAARYTGLFLLLVALMLTTVVISINTGNVNLKVSEIFDIIVKRSKENETPYSIIWKLRLPRLLKAALLGGALALSGFLLQTFFKNPIAGPFILGVSSGARMFLCAATIFSANYFGALGMNQTVVVTFLGSIISMLFVLMFAGAVKSMSFLLVIGVMISNVCSAVTDFMINFANEADIVNLTHWSLGSFSGATWDQLKVASVIILLAFIFSMLMSKPMEAYLFGENFAKSVGINIVLFRIMLIILSSILSACVVAFAGPISFVGIAVPQIAKWLFHTTKPVIMIPATFLIGAIFCMLCDLAARCVFAPTELNLSSVTAVVGAPIVIYLLLKKRRE